MTDIAIWCRLNGWWNVLFSSTKQVGSAYFFGRLELTAAPCDIDGDAKTDLVVYREADGYWLGAASSRQYELCDAFLGETGYRPVAADYDGDGLADAAVYGRTTGLWAIRLSGSNFQVVTGTFGGSGYLPVRADYDGDGLADPAIYAPSTADWQVLPSTSLTESKDMMQALLNNLTLAGKPPMPLAFPDGTRMLVLAFGGRVLGLFPPGSSENFLWTNPALATPESTAAWLRRQSWPNFGGDRTWLAPENDFFCPDYPKTSTYFQPRQLDPGRYRCERTGNGVRLVCDLKLRSYRTREDLRLRIVKQIEPAANPFHQATDLRRLATLPFAGYTLRSTLEICGKANRTVVGLWHLLQMPHGGRMLIPTRFRVNPTIYFGSPSRQDLVVGDRMVQYTMRSPGEHKIGVRAIALTGGAGYLYPCPQGWTLVVRDFHVNPSGSYVDALPNAGDSPADAFQACNVSNAQLGHFSELEYHVPAIGGSTGLTRCEDVSQVWAFRGALAAIRRVAAMLLGRT